MATPPLALQRCRAVAEEMAACAAGALDAALDSFDHYTPELAERIRRDEQRCDHYEDVLGTYLVKLSTQQMGAEESEEATEMLKTIGDLERISDHAVNVLESAEELRDKGLTFSGAACARAAKAHPATAALARNANGFNMGCLLWKWKRW